ncbi:MAG: SpoIIIAH-like family protein [Eubacteriales bacterium]|nr:SpoIIIAH-like family protein [Lachnospiraceae bacterium]MDO5126549.1 SpoIIIAH-like family protein [Eubacteriales bacterium]
MRNSKQEHVVNDSHKKEDVPKGSRIVKKNQIIIAALTVLLGVAGYINFSGNRLDLADGTATPQDSKATESAFVGLEQEETAGEVYYNDIEEAEHIELNSDEDSIGEAVLTSTNPALSAAAIKLNREQVRSKSKEYYLEIMNSDGMDEAAVQSATDAYMKLIDDMEKESEAETMLLAKGFTNVIVSIGEETVDVALGGEILSDVQRAQVEDIVCRKTGCTVDQIVITQIDD